MAGLVRPAQCLESIEANYKVIAFNFPNRPTNCPLFDGSYGNLFSWSGKYGYLDIEIYNKCNIWRSGYLSGGAIGKIQILKFDYNLNQFVNITENIEQNLSITPSKQWELYIENLSAGKYKFSINNTNRADSEWFLETTGFNLIKKDDDYYNINDSNYDINKQNYVPIVQNTTDKKDMYLNNIVDLSNLYMDKNINGETFKPADKLIPFRISKLKFK